MEEQTDLKSRNSLDYLDLYQLFHDPFGTAFPVKVTETASSNRVLSPSLVRAEHSTYAWSLRDFANFAPYNSKKIKRKSRETE